MKRYGIKLSLIHIFCVVSVEQRNDRDELITTALFTFAVVKRMDPILLPPKHPGLSF